MRGVVPPAICQQVLQPAPKIILAIPTILRNNLLIAFMQLQHYQVLAMSPHTAWSVRFILRQPHLPGGAFAQPERRGVIRDRSRPIWRSFSCLSLAFHVHLQALTGSNSMKGPNAQQETHLGPLCRTGTVPVLTARVSCLRQRHTGVRVAPASTQRSMVTIRFVISNTSTWVVSRLSIEVALEIGGQARAGCTTTTSACTCKREESMGDESRGRNDGSACLEREVGLVLDAVYYD